MHPLALAATLLAGALALGCSDAPEHVVRLDCEASLVSTCERAAATWNASLVGTRFVLAGEATRVIPVVVAEPGACADEASWMGCYDGRVSIDARAFAGWERDVVPRAMTGVLVHELGHALGLGHMASGIMRPGEWRFECVDALAAEALGAVATCSGSGSPP